MEVLLRDAIIPTTSVNLKVREDEDGIPQWQESRLPKLPPRQTQGPLQWSHLDPLTDYVFAQTDWSDGALRPYYRDGDRRYWKSDGVDLRWEGIAGLFTFPSARGLFSSAPRFGINQSISMVGENTGFEEGIITGWTISGNVTDVLIPDPYGGRFSLKLTTDGTMLIGDYLIYQDLTNPSIFQGKTIKVGVAIKRESGAEGLRIIIDDGVGTSTSTAVTAATFTTTTVSHNVDAAATQIRIALELDSNENSANVFFADDFGISVGTSGELAGTALLNGFLYAIIGSAIVKWNDTSDRFDVVYIGSGQATDIIQFKGNIYVAFGTSLSYVYGSNTTWTVSNRTAPDDKAVYWAVGKSGAGTWSLWKSETTSTVSNTPDGTNGATGWSATIEVGETQATITKMYSAFDSIVIGKEDGLYLYTRLTPTVRAATTSSPTSYQILQQSRTPITSSSARLGRGGFGSLQ